MRNQDFKEASPRLIENIPRYAELRAAELLTAREHVLECSLSKLDASANLEAVRFNRKLAEVVKGDPTYLEAKLKLIASIQELFEDFVIQGVRPPGTKKQGLLFQELSDEWYLQMYRLAEVHRAASAQRQNTKDFFNCMLVLALVSNYCIPANKSLHEGLLHWLLTLRTKMQSQDFKRVLTRALNNFQVSSEAEESAAHSQSDQDSVVTEEAEGASQNMGQDSHLEPKFESTATGVATWPPSSLEIDALLTGQPITVKVNLANGEQVAIAVDEGTTVEYIVDYLRETHPSLKHEHETETFWLFRLHDTRLEDGLDSAESLDFPLPKDKKVLKLIY